MLLVGLLVDADDDDPHPVLRSAGVGGRIHELPSDAPLAIAEVPEGLEDVPACLFVVLYEAFDVFSKRKSVGVVDSSVLMME